MRAHTCGNIPHKNHKQIRDNILIWILGGHLNGGGISRPKLIKMNWAIEPSSSVRLKKIKCNFDGRGFVSLSAPVYPSGEIIWEMQRYQVLSRLPEKPCETLWRYETLISRPIMCWGITHVHMHKTHVQTMHSHAHRHRRGLPQWPWRGVERMKQRQNVMRKRWPGETCSDFYQPVNPSLKTWGDTGADRTADWKPDLLKQTKSRGVGAAGGKYSEKPAARPREKICHPCRR